MDEERMGRARVLAAHMPFVHHPVDRSLSDTASWKGLSPAASRDVAPSRNDDAARFRHTHVFAYAGPACFTKGQGRVTFFFRPSVEAHGAPGAVCRFDTGALLEPKGCLQPWSSKRPAGTAGRPLDFARVDVCSSGLSAWREVFSRWLAHAYVDPNRYTEALGDPHTDGRPDELHPAELLTHNGHAPAADRRAWTWEARFRGTLPLEHVAAVLVAPEDLEAASARFASAEIHALPTTGPSDATLSRVMYVASSVVLRSLIP